MVLSSVSTEFYSVFPRTRETGPGVGGERRYSKAPLNPGLWGKPSGLGVSRDQADCGPGGPSGLEMLPGLPSSDRWVGPGPGHLGALPTSQQRLLQSNHVLGSISRGRGPGEKDTVVSGVPSALNSLSFPPFEEGGVKLPCPWAGGSDINRTVA